MSPVPAVCRGHSASTADTQCAVCDGGVPTVCARHVVRHRAVARCSVSWPSYAVTILVWLLPSGVWRRCQPVCDMGPVCDPGPVCDLGPVCDPNLLLAVWCPMQLGRCHPSRRFAADTAQVLRTPSVPCVTAVCRPYVPIMWFDTAQLRGAASAGVSPPVCICPPPE
jgi:hypothetical protein